MINSGRLLVIGARLNLPSGLVCSFDQLVEGDCGDLVRHHNLRELGDRDERGHGQDEEEYEGQTRAEESALGREREALGRLQLALAHAERRWCCEDGEARLHCAQNGGLGFEEVLHDRATNRPSNRRVVALHEGLEFAKRYLVIAVKVGLVQELLEVAGRCGAAHVCVDQVFEFSLVDGARVVHVIQAKLWKQRVSKFLGRVPDCPHFVRFHSASLMKRPQRQAIDL
mmetsp:Transcript_38438/g.104581  ORF Transcript_38438/g.104581 Transcript_38438/m.104581 type:complete len:227 (+) Transcript_38438:1090-1770(+)